MLRAIQEIIEPSHAKIKREHSLIDESPEQGSSYRIKELEVSPAGQKYP